MKKLFITALAVVTFGATAQDVNFKSKRGENLLPEKGDWAIGFNADGIFDYVGNSFNGNTGNAAPSVTYNKGNVGTFVGKKFITDKTAYRIIANLRLNSQDITEPTIYPIPVVAGTTTTTTVITSKTVISGFDLTAGLGKEWRRGKTRLQGFYGADVFVKLNSLTTTNNSSSDVTSVTVNPTPAPATTNLFNSSTETINKSGFGFGIGAQGFLGAEYFLFPKIAIGAQYTYGLNLSFSGKQNTSISTSSTGNPTVSSSKDGAANNIIGLSGVGVSSINLTLHF
jgi:hypothetical protein